MSHNAAAHVFVLPVVRLCLVLVIILFNLSFLAKVFSGGINHNIIIIGLHMFSSRLQAWELLYVVVGPIHFCPDVWFC